ncbi:hypothetical protein GEW_02158, partial [Pasteurella multocida subsp. gallicida str. Anand1_poultry]
MILNYIQNGEDLSYTLRSSTRVDHEIYGQRKTTTNHTAKIHNLPTKTSHKHRFGITSKSAIPIKKSLITRELMNTVVDQNV